MHDACLFPALGVSILRALREGWGMSDKAIAEAAAIGSEVVKRRAPVLLISMFVLLVLLTGGLIAGVGYGFYTGVLTPYWTNLSDAHAAIFAQLIFFLAAAWASVLVPLLFREQLRNLEDAADRAKNTYDEMERRLGAAVATTEVQFKRILRLQMMSVSHLLDEQLAFLESPEDKKAFVDAQWEKAKSKVDAAIALQHGARRNALSEKTYRSNSWWEALLTYNVLGEHYSHFKTISDKKNKLRLEIEDLQAVNAASARIEGFTAHSTVTRAGVTPEVSTQLPPAASAGEPPHQLPN